MLTCKIRRLAADGAVLYLQLDRWELASQQLDEGVAVRLDLGGRAHVDGIVRTKGATCWLGPAASSSNKAITEALRAIGGEHGGELRATIADRRQPVEVRR